MFARFLKRPLFLALMAAGCSRSPPPSIPEEDVITIETGPCYGSCPSYLLTFRPDGTIVYQGESYVASRGPFSTQISRTEFSALVDRFDAIHYEELTWDKECIGRYVRDQSTITTSITRKGRKHSLKHYLGNWCAPKELKTLENALLAAPGSILQSWVHCDGGCPR